MCWSRAADLFCLRSDYDGMEHQYSAGLEAAVCCPFKGRCLARRTGQVSECDLRRRACGGALRKERSFDDLFMCATCRLMPKDDLACFLRTSEERRRETSGTRILFSFCGENSTRA